jgi:endonuclease YncB( thermonuclease family)
MRRLPEIPSLRAVITVLLALASGLAAAWGAEPLPGPYDAQLLEVVDGDTIRVRIRIWVDIDTETLVRIDGIDTPELRGRCEEEAALAHRARGRVESLTADAELALYDIRYGKFAGRVVARVEAGGKDIGRVLLAEELARPYSGGRRTGWCD